MRYQPDGVRFPSLPPIVEGAGGPIRVRFIKDPRTDKREPCWGLWDDGKRVIYLARGMTREQQWRMLFHELTHAALYDAGHVYTLTEDANEALCNAMATARINEFRAQLLGWYPGRRRVSDPAR